MMEDVTKEEEDVIRPQMFLTCQVASFALQGIGLGLVYVSAEWKLTAGIFAILAGLSFANAARLLASGRRLNDILGRHKSK